MNRINWDDYFMSIAYLVSLRSKDPKTKVGACIVNKNKRIISTGYNSMPNNCDDNMLCWESKEGLEDKHLYVVHAEVNAIINSKTDLSNCIMYTTLYPCNKCAQTIIQSGINELIYLDCKYEDTDMIKAARIILDMAGIHQRQLQSDFNININLLR